MPKQPDHVYLVSDVYSHALLGVYPTKDEAYLAADNTPASCAIHKVTAKVIERSSC